mgnify:FL=1
MAQAASRGGTGIISFYRSFVVNHPLAAYAVRRFGVYLLTLWGSITITFFFFRLIPGNPIDAYIQNLQTMQQNYSVQASEATVQYYKEAFGLNGSLLEQYVRYMNQLVLHQNFGPSLINYPNPAQVVIARALPWTIGLLGVSTVIMWIIGVVLGAILGWKRDKPISGFVTYLAIAFSHIPYYFVALILVFLLSYRLGWLPSTAAYDPGYKIGFTPEFITSVIKHAILPSLSIIVIGVANWMVSTRMLIVPMLGEDFLTFAEAKGLRPGYILTRYALRNCWLPQVIGLGIGLGSIFNGNVLVEQLFNYPGVGNLFVQATAQLDYNTMMGVVILAIFGVLTANLILDLLLPAIDPRVKYWR